MARPSESRTAQQLHEARTGIEGGSGRRRSIGVESWHQLGGAQTAERQGVRRMRRGGRVSIAGGRQSVFAGAEMDTADDRRWAARRFFDGSTVEPAVAALVPNARKKNRD